MFGHFCKNFTFLRGCLLFSHRETGLWAAVGGPPHLSNQYPFFNAIYSWERLHCGPQKCSLQTQGNTVSRDPRTGILCLVNFWDGVFTSWAMKLSSCIYVSKSQGQTHFYKRLHVNAQKDKSLLQNVYL